MGLLVYFALFRNKFEQAPIRAIRTCHNAQAMFMYVCRDERSIHLREGPTWASLINSALTRVHILLYYTSGAVAEDNRPSWPNQTINNTYTL